ncbi:hypothetical protein [Blastococcus sp. SYSU DS0619]
MAPPSAPAPGNLTVPPLFDWHVLASVVLVAAVLAVVAVIVLSARAGASGRDEWQQWLAGRSRAGHDPDDPRGGRYS